MKKREKGNKECEAKHFQSPHCMIPASQYPRGMIPWRVNLSGKSYPGESIKKLPKYNSPRYDTPASQSPRGISYPGKLVLFNLKFEKLREILIKSENILTHRSVAHADSNNEKNGGRKSRWTVSLMPNSKNVYSITISSITSPTKCVG